MYFVHVTLYFVHMTLYIIPRPFYITHHTLYIVLEMSGATIVSWGLCLPNCPYIVPEVVCINPPKVPKFGMRNSTGHVIQENYNSSWFKLEFINETDNR